MNYRRAYQCARCGAYSPAGCGDDYCPFLLTLTPPPRGCICPPTSEQTCRSPSCPRLPIGLTVFPATQVGVEPV